MSLDLVMMMDCGRICCRALPASIMFAQRKTIAHHSRFPFPDGSKSIYSNS